MTRPYTTTLAPYRIWSLDARYRPINVVERLTTGAGAVRYAKASFVRVAQPEDAYWLVTRHVDGYPNDIEVVKAAFSRYLWSDPTMLTEQLPAYFAAQVIVNASRYAPFVGGV